MNKLMKQRIEMKLQNELKYGFPHSRNWTEKQKNRQMKALREKFLVPEEDMRLIVAYCIYNEEQFFEKSLKSNLNLDVDEIWILDGAWEHGGTDINSTDASKDIALKFSGKYGMPVIWQDNPYDRLWKNESEKRNYQLTSIEKKYKGKPHYILVRDGDEIIRWKTGRNNTWLKRTMMDYYKTKLNIGMVEAYAYESDFATMYGVRLIPGGEGIHYYTERSMIIHDGDCNLIINYNPQGEMNGDKSRLFMNGDFFFVNQWNIRNADRLNIKDRFADYQQTLINVKDPCQYNMEVSK